MQTRRFPRTMQQAFGPYTTHDLHPMRESRTENIAGAVVIVVVMICSAAAFVHAICGGWSA